MHPFQFFRRTNTLQSEKTNFVLKYIINGVKNVQLYADYKNVDFSKTTFIKKKNLDMNLDPQCSIKKNLDMDSDSGSKTLIKVIKIFVNLSLHV